MNYKWKISLHVSEGEKKKSQTREKTDQFHDAYIVKNNELSEWNE